MFSRTTRSVAAAGLLTIALFQLSLPTVTDRSSKKADKPKPQPKQAAAHVRDTLFVDTFPSCTWNGARNPNSGKWEVTFTAAPREVGMKKDTKGHPVLTVTEIPADAQARFHTAILDSAAYAKTSLEGQREIFVVDTIVGDTVHIGTKPVLKLLSDFPANLPQ